MSTVLSYVTKAMEWAEIISMAKWFLNEKTGLSSMIHSARPTVPLAAVTLLPWKLFCEILKSADTTCGKATATDPYCDLALGQTYRKF